MKRFYKYGWIRFVGILIAASWGACVTPHPPKEENTSYRISIKNNFVPFSYTDSNGVLRGIDVEIIEAIAKEQGFTYTLVPLNTDEYYDHLFDESVDAALNIMPTEDYTSYNDLSIPYYKTKIELTIDSSNHEIRTIYDLKDKKAGVLRGSYCEDYLSIHKESLGLDEIVSLNEDYSTIATRMINKEFDCCLFSVNTINLLKKEGFGLKSIAYPFDIVRLSLAVKKGRQADLLASFNNGLQKITENKKLNIILEKYDHYRDEVDFHILIPSTDYFPFSYFSEEYIVDEEKIRSGIEVDILDAIASDQGFTFQFVFCDESDNHLDYFELHTKDSSYLDGVIGAIPVDELNFLQRELGYSLPYFTTQSCILIRKDNEIVNNMKDLVNNASISVRKNTPEEDILFRQLKESHFFPERIYSLSSVDDVVESVVEGNSDACILEKTYAQLIEQNSSLKIIFDCENYYSYSLIVRKNKSERLLQAFNLGLSHITNDGSYDAILDRHIYNVIQQQE